MASIILSRGSILSRGMLRAAVPSSSRAFAGYAENVCDLISGTPMVKLNKVVPVESVASKILLKVWTWL